MSEVAPDPVEGVSLLWRLDERGILRKQLLISDAFDEL